jgi:hypothetical protein
MNDEFEADRWEPNFSGDSYVVVSRLGPFRRWFPKPKNFRPRFYHRVVELAIEDWEVPVPMLQLGDSCRVTVDLSIRFQPTLSYLRNHPEVFGEIGHSVRLRYQKLILDRVQEELRILEDPFWLKEGLHKVEQRIEILTNETLAGQEIRCRTRCQLRPEFDPIDEAAVEALDPWSPYRRLCQTLLARQRAVAEEETRRRHEEELLILQSRLERERAALELQRLEEALRKTRYEQETERLRSELAAAEALQAEHRAAEARQREEQIRHERKLREMEIEAEIEQKTRRAEAMDETESRLRREIELLAMERQRILLEEEIQDIKLAKARGWVINAKRRFPLGKKRELGEPAGENQVPPEDPEA